jgi:hypothetical protein
MIASNSSPNSFDPHLWASDTADETTLSSSVDCWDVFRFAMTSPAIILSNDAPDEGTRLRHSEEDRIDSDTFT